LEPKNRKTEGSFMSLERIGIAFIDEEQQEAVDTPYQKAYDYSLERI